MIDGLLVSKITKNLREKLISGKIQKIYQINNSELLLKIRANRTNYQLLNSIQSNSFRLQLTNKHYSTLNAATNLTMSLRKHLEGGIISDILQNECDRTITFEITKFNELRDEQKKYLIFELVGRHSNTILCDYDFKIIDTLKNIPLSQSLTRIVHRGATYAYVDLKTKLNPLNGIENSDNYQEKYQGFSKYLSQEFIYQNEQCHSAQELFNEYQASETVYCYNNIVSYLKLDTQAEQPRIFSDIDEAFDNIFHQESENESINYTFKKEIKMIKAHVKKNIKKIKKLELQYESNLDYNKFRLLGTLLYDNIYLFDKNKHYSKVSVFDYENDKEVMIVLDDKFNITINAQRFLQKYHKMKKSFVYLTDQIKLAQNQNEIFEATLDNLEYAKINDVKEIMEDLHNKNLIKLQSKPVKRKPNYKPKYETYYSSDNSTILVGKNNIQNDYITFKMAHRDDIWLHIKNLAGSHVVILNSEPSDETIEEAAKLALVYSKALADNSYDVDYTAIKNIKKLKGSKLGQITFSTNQTIRVANDLNILNQLKRG